MVKVWFSNINILADTQRQEVKNQLFSTIHLIIMVKAEDPDRKLPVRLVESRIKVSQVSSTEDTGPVNSKHTKTT